MCSPTRRTFLRTGALAAISAGFALSSVRLAFGQESKQTNPALDFQVPYETQLDPVFNYTKATFEPYVGGLFSARGNDGRQVTLTLVAVRDLSDKVRARVSNETAAQFKRRQRVAVITTKSRATNTFALVFHASGPLSELSTIHQLDHAALGKFSLFLVGSEGESGRRVYEAVISHPAQ
ncbi:MAG: hypothetical protein LC802_19420 [Acidobacteria bacterium]|nr:hypothetical protein [Acidobacteriota bacterium]